MLFDPIANLQKRGLGEVDSAWLDRASALSNRAEESVFKLGKEIKDDGRDSNDAS